MTLAMLFVNGSVLHIVLVVAPPRTSPHCATAKVHGIDVPAATLLIAPTSARVVDDERVETSTTAPISLTVQYGAGLLGRGSASDPAGSDRPEPRTRGLLEHATLVFSSACSVRVERRVAGDARQMDVLRAPRLRVETDRTGMIPLS
jgi:hypothetical protein